MPSMDTSVVSMNAYINTQVQVHVHNGYRDGWIPEHNCHRDLSIVERIRPHHVRLKKIFFLIKKILLCMCHVLQCCQLFC